MAKTQESREPETPDDNTEEIEARLKKTKAEAKSALARARAEEKARLKAEKALSETREDLESIQAEVEEEREARLEAERVLTEIQEDLNAAQGEIQRERQARAQAEQARDEAEKAWTKEMRSLQLDEEKEKGLELDAEEKREQRVSFIVRLTVDESGRPKRTEVEHPTSDKKESFPSLDVQRIATFMKACISPPTALRPDPLPDLSSQRPEMTKEETKSPATAVTISDIKVYRGEDPSIPTLILNQDEAFTVQARFRIEGPNASSITAKETRFEMQIYARSVNLDRSLLLKVYQGNLAKDVFEYLAQMQVPGLPAGLHRLLTLVTLYEPINMISQHEEPVIKVLEELPSPDPAIMMGTR